MAKKRRSGKPLEPIHVITARYGSENTTAVALTMASFTCLSVLATAGVEVNTATGAILAVLLAVSKVCKSMGYR